LEIVRRLPPTPEKCWYSICRQCRIVIKANEAEVSNIRQERSLNFQTANAKCPECQQSLGFSLETEEEMDRTLKYTM